MTEELTMPKLSDSMLEGTILTWLKADGEYVEAGEELLEIEADKATMTVEASASGVLRIIAPEGTSLPVGSPIARLGEAAEAPAPRAAEAAASPTAEAAPAPTADARTPNTQTPASGNGHTSVRATPLARRVAVAHGVSLADVAGSGPAGRVTRNDVLVRAGLIAPRPGGEPVQRGSGASAPARSGASAPARSGASAPARSGASAPAVENQTGGAGSSLKGRIEVLDPSRLQSVVARRMAEAFATIPHFQVQTEVEMDRALAVRAQLKELADAAPSVNDLIVKAVSLALREHPGANSAYLDGKFERYSRVNIGIAVAADGALVVPTIFDADQKSLGQIAREAVELSARVRDGAITPSEQDGATFTVSNLGMYGMTAITPVVNPPQAAILGVGALRSVLARVDGEVIDRQLLTLTLSCDHRILYGADAARLLSSIRQLLEQPLRLAL